MRIAMLDRLYGRVMELAARRSAMWWLAGVSFAESSVFPIPPDVMLVPMVLARRARAWAIAALCTAASALGGLAGYAIGYAFWEAVGEPLVALYGYEAKMGDFADRYREWGAWIVFIAGITPFPYKVITIASGFAGLDVVVFTLASVASRGLRFFVEAALLWRFGAPIRRFVERHMGLLGIVFAASLVAGFAVLAFIE